MKVWFQNFEGKNYTKEIISFSISMGHKNTQILISIKSTICLEDTTKINVIFEKIPKKIKLHPKFRLENQNFSIFLNAFCPSTIDGSLKNLFESLGNIEGSTSAITQQAVILFSAINLNTVAASSVFFVSKFLRIPFPEMIASTHKYKPESIMDEYGQKMIANAKKKDNLPAPPSLFYAYHYSPFIWNNNYKALTFIGISFLLLVLFLGICSKKLEKIRLQREKEREEKGLDKFSEKSLSIVEKIIFFLNNFIQAQFITNASLLSLGFAANFKWTSFRNFYGIANFCISIVFGYGLCRVIILAYYVAKIVERFENARPSQLSYFTKRLEEIVPSPVP